MKKSFEKNRSKKATMDSISVPDTEKIRKLSDPDFKKGTGINKTADDIFEGNRFNKVGYFDRATKYYESPTDKRYEYEQEEDEDNFDDFDNFKAKTDPERKAPNTLDKGVKVGSQYVKRKRVIAWIVVIVLLLACALLFLPPISSPDTDESGVLHEENPFKSMGMTEFKTYALSNFSVYNEDAFSSEKSENYRIVKLTVHLQNPSPFEVTIPQYKVSHVSSEYEDKICYVTATQKDKDQKVVGDIIPAFASKDVEIQLMVNVEGMSESVFRDAVTGVVLSTSGMKKKISDSAYLPCIPMWIFVSNGINVEMDL